MGINKPMDYETTKAFGGWNALKPGGYVCEIVAARETTSKAGNQMLELQIDIAEGDELGRFSKQYKDSDSIPKKWPNSGIIRQVILNKDGGTNGNFKALVECVEKGNGTKALWGEPFCDWIKGRLIGVIFYREQYRGNDGQARWSVKPYMGYKTAQQIRSGDYTVPEDKPLPGGDVPSGFEVLRDGEIPF